MHKSINFLKSRKLAILISLLTAIFFIATVFTIVFTSSNLATATQRDNNREDVGINASSSDAAASFEKDFNEADIKLGPNGERAIAVWNNDGHSISFYYDLKDHSSEGQVFDWESYDWRMKLSDVTYYIDNSFIGYRPVKGTRCFARGVNIYGITNLITDEMTSMYDMFVECRNIENLNISHFRTDKVTTMVSMFQECDSLSTIDVTHFNTSNVDDMNFMFMGCDALTSLDVSNFDTHKVTNMHGMFSSCRSLSSINVSNFSTSKVTDMSGMFSGCEQLTNINLDNFDTSNVTDMSTMFFACHSLQDITLNNFKTGNVTDMEMMFGEGYKLASVNITSFDTSKVTNMRWMFCRCYVLKTLDLTSFNTGKVKDMGIMFDDDYSLETIYTLNNADWSDCEITDGMFHNCNVLTGGQGTKCDPSRTDGHYARVDGLNGNPGYFTGKEGPLPPIPRQRTYTNIGVCNYSFPNFASDIDISLWRNRLSKYLPDYQIWQLYENDRPNGGLCFGFVMSSSLINIYDNPSVDSIVSPSGIHAVTVFDTFKDWRCDEYCGGNIENYIKIGQTWQDIPFVARQKEENKAWGTSCSDILSLIYTNLDDCLHGSINSPISIGIYSGSQGHRILPIGIDEDNLSYTKVIIYDPNHPSEERYLFLEKNNEGYCGWHYQMFDNVEWSSRDVGGAINFLYINSSYLSEENFNNDYNYTGLVTVNHDDCILKTNGKTYVLNLNKSEDINNLLPLNIEDHNKLTSSYFVNFGKDSEFSNINQDTELRLSTSDGGMYINTPAGGVLNTDMEQDKISAKISKEGAYSTGVTFLEKSESGDIEKMIVEATGNNTLSLSKDSNDDIDFVGLSTISADKGDKHTEANNLNPEKTYTIKETDEEILIIQSIEDATVAPIDSQVYTGQEITPTPVVLMGETALVEGTDYELEYKDNINTGKATINIKGIGNYTGVKTVTFSINPMKITVIANDVTKQYGDADPLITGKCEKEDGSDVDNPPEITYTREAGEALGDYAISSSTTNINFSIQKTTGKLTIIEKNLAVKANDVTKEYGDVDPEFSGRAYGDDGKEVTNLPVITYTRESGEELGDYDITASTIDTNYVIVETTGKLTITAKKINIPEGKTLTYNAAEQIGVLDGEGYELTDNKGVYPQEYLAKALLTDTAHTVWSDETITDKSIQWSIQKAMLTAVYVGETIDVGDKPNLEVEVTGFVGNESAETAEGYVAPVIELPKDLQPGKYTLTPTGGKADYYDFDYVSGTLKVNGEPTPQHGGNDSTNNATTVSQTGDNVGYLVIGFAGIVLAAAVLLLRRKFN